MTTQEVLSATDVPTAGRPTKARGLVFLGQVSIWVGLLIGWQYLSSLPGMQSLIGSPAGVVARFGEWWADPAFWVNVVSTTTSALLGFLVGGLAACIAVVLTWPFAFMRTFVSPFLSIGNALPRIALAPLFILWFGIGPASSVVFVVTIIFLIVYLNIFNGLSSIDPVFRENARVLGASRLQLATTVYVPAVTAWLMTSLKLAVVWSILGAAMAEYLAGAQGLGSYLRGGAIVGDPNMLLAAGITLALLSLLADRTLALVERRFSQWRIF